MNLPHSILPSNSSIKYFFHPHSMTFILCHVTSATVSTLCPFLISADLTFQGLHITRRPLRYPSDVEATIKKSDNFINSGFSETISEYDLVYLRRQNHYCNIALKQIYSETDFFLDHRSATVWDSVFLLVALVVGAVSRDICSKNSTAQQDAVQCPPSSADELSDANNFINPPLN